MPAVSDTEKLVFRVRVDVRGVPTTAVDVAVMVHVVEFVCTMPVIAEMLVNVKSTPLELDTVVQSIASLPVRVKSMLVDDEVAVAAASVRVGGVVSTTEGVYRTMTTPSPAVPRTFIAVPPPAPPPVFAAPAVPCWPEVPPSPPP